MEISSKNKLILLSTVLLTGAVSASQLTIGQHQAQQPKAQNHSLANVTYTAHGTTDRKTALLFKQLMKNRKNLQITAEVSPSSKSAYSGRTQGQHAAKQPMEVEINYTVRGKTTVANMKKLIKLFKTHKRVEVVAEANIDVTPNIVQHNRRLNKHRYNNQWQQQPQNYRQPAYAHPTPYGSPNANRGYNPYDQSHPVYYYGNSYGYGYNYQANPAIHQPLYVQAVAQPMVWYLMPVSNTATTQSIAQRNYSKKKLMVAEN